MAFQAIWPLVDPCMTFDPSVHYTSVKGSLYQIWLPQNIHKKFDPWLTLVESYMTFDPINALHFGQGSFVENLVATEHSWTIWPQLIPGCPFTPSVHHTFGRGSFYQIWLPRNFLEKFDPWLTPGEPCMTLYPNNALHFGQGFLENMLSNLVGQSLTPKPTSTRYLKARRNT